jgi:hypothetical protein
MKTSFPFRLEYLASVGSGKSGKLLTLATLVLSCGLGGCYERVVGARGPGAGAVRVEQSYQTDNAVDRWIFGEQNDPRHGLPRSGPGSWNGN